VACIAEVQVEKSRGVVRVKRLVAAHDCGLIINPDGVKNQIEGNMLQSLSRGLKEEVRFDVTHHQRGLGDVPDPDVFRRPGDGDRPARQRPAPAVANAIFDATGARASACARCRLHRSGYEQRCLRAEDVSVVL
jgi:nicotinate dehydrogenase subunit B